MKMIYSLAASAVTLACIATPAAASELRSQAQPNFVTAAQRPLNPAKANAPVVQPNVESVAPTHIVRTYTVPAGGVGAAFTVPPKTPIHIGAVGLASGYRAAGEVELLSIPGSGGFLEWSGVETASTNGPGAITSSYSGAAGTHVLWVDYADQVDLQVASPNSLQVVNNSDHSTQVVVTIDY